MKKRLHLYKYQGAGNDFILLDNRQGKYTDLEYGQIARLCDRRFGIGADGLMMLDRHPAHTFCMRFFNSDGMPGSMCGNGGRCISAFALNLGLVEENVPFSFWSSDGEHHACILSSHGSQQMVRLQMRDVGVYACHGSKSAYLLDTGSPHYVLFCRECGSVNVVDEGRKIRFSEDFPLGVNVDFVERNEEYLSVRTYERGVEDETFACGTGAVASAMALALKEHFPLGGHRVDVTTKGGQLQVDFTLELARPESPGEEQEETPVVPLGFSVFRNRVFSHVFLEGLATFVFEADIEIDS